MAKQQKFGFKNGRNGVHSSRTMMLAEVSALFQARDADTTREQYQEDVRTFNVLHKPTDKARCLTWRHLVDLYGMDPAIPLFRVFRRLWDSDEYARALLACQIGLTRDPILRGSRQKILSLQMGELLPRQEMEQVFSEKFPSRFSAATLKSIAQNVNGTWTKAGYLIGRTKKTRSAPVVRPANVAFALFLGYLQGASGNRLFSTEWVYMFECHKDRLLEYARTANNVGLISFKHSSEVIEISFPNYLTKEEESWLNE